MRYQNKLREDPAPHCITERLQLAKRVQCLKFLTSMEVQKGSAEERHGEEGMQRQPVVYCCHLSPSTISRVRKVLPFYCHQQRRTSFSPDISESLMRAFAVSGACLQSKTSKRPVLVLHLSSISVLVENSRERERGDSTLTTFSQLHTFCLTASAFS